MLKFGYFKFLSKENIKHIKKIIRTFKPEKFKKLRTAQPEPQFTGSYKNNVYVISTSFNQ